MFAARWLAVWEYVICKNTHILPVMPCRLKSMARNVLGEEQHGNGAQSEEEYQGCQSKPRWRSKGIQYSKLTLLQEQMYCLRLQYTAQAHTNLCSGIVPWHSQPQSCHCHSFSWHRRGLWTLKAQTLWREQRRCTSFWVAPWPDRHQGPWQSRLAGALRVCRGCPARDILQLLMGAMESSHGNNLFPPESPWYLCGRMKT